jgi:hypothetical protein
MTRNWKIRNVSKMMKRWLTSSAENPVRHRSLAGLFKEVRNVSVVRPSAPRAIGEGPTLLRHRMED